MPLELRSPGGLWLLSLIIPLVVLYLLKVRRTRIVVSSTWLWTVAARDLLARHPLRRLVAQVPLILQILALALLALALARPAARGSGVAGDQLAIIVDSSASMGALAPDGRPRMSAAREVAHQLIRSLAPGAQAMIVEAGRDARLAAPLDRDQRRLRSAIDSLEARDVEGHLDAALSLATDRLRHLPGTSRLVVITDESLAHPMALAGTSLPVETIKVGSPIENAGLVRIDVRSGVDPVTRRDQIQVFALVVNFAARSRDLFVTLRQKDVAEPLASRRVQLGPGERAPVVLDFEPAPSDAGSGIVVELSPGDAFAADDRAYGRVPVGRRIPVLISPADANPWIERALLADPDVELSEVPLAAIESAAVPPDALVVVDGTCPKAPGGASLLVLNPPPGPCRTAVVGDRMSHPTVTSWQNADPRLRFLALDTLELSAARRVTTEHPAEALIRAGDGVLVSDISLPGRTGTLVSFDVGESNWPLQASFVLFVRNLVEVARAERAHGVVGPARTGAPLRVRVPSQTDTVRVSRPVGTPRSLSARDGLVVVPEVDRAGFYQLSWQGSHAGSVLVAANLTSELESDTRPHPIPRPEGILRARAASDLVAHTDYDYWLAALALLLIAIDAWWLTHRARHSVDLMSRAPRLPERPG
jgi:hypothetical protein